MMKIITTSALVLSFFVLPAHSFAVSADDSPEEICVQSLIASAGGHTAYSGLDFSALEKINGPEGSQSRSQSFSVMNYEEFLAISKKEVPLVDDDLSYFPDQMNRVPASYSAGGGIHKSNRGNVGYLLYTDDVAVSIGDLDGDGKDETIDGYYVDSRYVTFGRQSDLEFSFPTRSPNPAEDREFPTGAPVGDMREYLIFTHHLSPGYGGDFLSCGLVKVSPADEYALKSFSGEKSIRWAYYGYPRPTETNVRIDQQSYGNKRFHMGDMRYVVSAKERALDDEKSGYVFNNDLLTFNVLVSSFDNGNDFMNEFKTFEVFADVMNDANKVTSSFLQSRIDFYKALAEKSGELNLSILGDIATSSNDDDASARLDSRDLYASVLDVSPSNPKKAGGLSLMPGVTLDTYQKVESIEDVPTRNMLRSALISDYGENVGNFSDKNDFEKAYNSHPLTLAEQIENVEYLLDNTDNIEGMVPEEFEYKDMVFGEAVIPIADRRLRAIVNQDYVDEEVSNLSETKERALESLVVTDDMSVIEKEEVYRKRKAIEDTFVADVSKAVTFENKYKEFKIEFADIENKFKQGRITESVYEGERKSLFNEFNNIAEIGKFKTVISSDKFQALTDELIGKKVPALRNDAVVKNPVVRKTNQLDVRSLLLKGGAILLFILAVGLAFWSVKKIKKESNIK